MKKTIVISLLCLFLYACDIFESRDPEDPKVSRTGFVAATTPDILFSNLMQSFDEKFTDDYLRNLVDTTFLKKGFRFIPSSGSINQFSILSNWSIDAERQYFDKIISIPPEGVPINLSLTNENAIFFGDSAVYNYDYTLFLPSEDEALNSNYKGSLRFVINLDSRSQWVITVWEDIKIDNEPSWSELKGRFY